MTASPTTSAASPERQTPTAATESGTGLARAHGVVVALLTPYEREGEPDLATVRRLVESHLACGVDGFYVGGSTGDGMMLPHESRVAQVTAVSEVVAGQVPVIAHVGADSTLAAIRLAHAAVDAGASAVSSIVPPIPLTASQIVRFFDDVASAVDAPFIAYNFPARTGITLGLEIFEELTQNPSFYGVKNTSFNHYELAQFTRLGGGGRVRVWNGHDEATLPALVSGADGCIGSSFNIAPGLYVDLVRAYRAGDLARAQDLQRQAQDLITVLLRRGIFASLRAVLERQGVPMGPAIRPLVTLSPAQTDELHDELAHQELLDLVSLPLSH